jgi:Cof subfamily protein (haloacid dehalogenase superfamily)
MSIRLLALDLDGTLVADLHTIPARTRAAIQAATGQGVQVVIATGREYGITKKFVNTLGLTTPIICYQGAWIYDPQTGQSIGNEGLPVAMAHELIELARARRLMLNLYVDHKAYVEYLTDTGRVLFGSLGTPLLQVKDLKEAITTPPIKGLICHPASSAGLVAAELKAALNGRLSVFRSLDTLIEVTAPGVSKGRALAVLANHYNIAQDEVMAIGDHDNDIEMIAWAGLGIAMGNASAGARAAADYIAPPLTEEGAAWAIEHFILKEHDRYD